MSSLARILICSTLLLSVIYSSTLLEDLQDEAKVKAMLEKVEELLQKTDDGTVCSLGTHVNNDKCDTNNDWCDDYDTLSGNCTRCSFWAWQVRDYQQGFYCATHWWAWFLIFLGIIVGLALLTFLLKYFCRGTTKKTTAYPNANRYETDLMNMR